MSKNTKETIFTDCPIRNVLSHICDKWSLLVLYALRNSDAMRFSALRKGVPDISQKMLTSTLRALESDGYVTRKVYAEVPPRVEYAITPRANTLIPLIDNLILWAEDNMAEIIKDRKQAEKHAQILT